MNLFIRLLTGDIDFIWRWHSMWANGNVCNLCKWSNSWPSDYFVFDDFWALEIHVPLAETISRMPTLLTLLADGEILPCWWDTLPLCITIIKQLWQALKYCSLWCHLMKKRQSTRVKKIWIRKVEWIQIVGQTNYCCQILHPYQANSIQ